MGRVTAGGGSPTPRTQRLRSAAASAAPATRPLTAKIDGRRSAIRRLVHAEPRILAEAERLYREVGPMAAIWYVRGFRSAKAELWESVGTFGQLRAMTDEKPAA